MRGPMTEDPGSNPIRQTFSSVSLAAVDPAVSEVSQGLIEFLVTDHGKKQAP